MRCPSLNERLPQHSMVANKRLLNMYPSLAHKAASSPAFRNEAPVVASFRNVARSHLEAGPVRADEI